MSFSFTKENIKKIEDLKKRYPNNNALVLPLLWMAQEQEGYIPLEAMEEIADISKLPPMHIYKTATFYEMFHLQKTSKYNIKVCKTLSCALCGKDEIASYIKEKIKDNDLFTYSEVECLGSCHSAPVMQINDTLYENLTTQKIDKIIEDLK